MHDILEDTDITRNDLLDYGFSEDIIIVVEILTKPKNKKYMDYIESIKNNNTAQKVKFNEISLYINISLL